LQHLIVSFVRPYRSHLARPGQSWEFCHLGREPQRVYMRSHLWSQLARQKAELEKHCALQLHTPVFSACQIRYVMPISPPACWLIEAGLTT
jgi:hypothetical protein